MGRSPCCDKSSVKKGPWAPEEDAKLKDFIEKFGTGGNWISLPQKAGLRRCGKSCRLRWLNYLRPNIKHGEFSEEEDRIICTLYASIGSRWSIIAAHLPGRTDNDIKNYWNTKLKKKLMGFASPDQAKSPTILTSPYQSQLPLSTFSQLYSSFFTQPTKPLPPIDPSQNYLYNTNFPFQHNQFSYITNQENLFVDFQGYNAGKDQNMLIFGANEASCSNSSNGSCGYGKDHVIKQEQMGCVLDQDCNLIDPLSAFVGQKVYYDLEEVKEPIGIHGSCDNNFLYYY